MVVVVVLIVDLRSGLFLPPLFPSGLFFFFSYSVPPHLVYSFVV